MKKITIFAFSLLIAILYPLQALAFYTDVPSSSKYYEEIKTLYDSSLLPEYEDNSFQPSKKLTTNDLYDLILYYGNSKNDTNKELTFIPNDKLTTKHRTLSTMFKFFGIGTDYFFNENSFPFKDLDPNTETAAIAMKAAEIGIIEDSSPAFFKMAKRLTRADLAHYLYLINNYTPSVKLEIDFSQTDDENLEIFLDAYERLTTDFLYKDQVSDEELIYGAIKGMAEKSGDIYTNFMDPEEGKEFLDSLSGSVEGIGVSVEQMENGYIEVITPLKGSPAEKAGVLAGDVIKEVDGESILNMSIEKAITLIKGEKGTKVKIKVQRGTKHLTFTITRAEIDYDTVEAKLLEKNGKKIGYIEVIIFGDNSYTEFTNKTQEMIDAGAEGLIIDVRNNPGGYMDSAMGIFGLFTDTTKTVLKLVDADGFTISEKISGTGELKGIKTVVLINGSSASASEIFAGALKDYKLATIIGETSFGKGSVQKLAEYKDKSILKYTTSKWLTPLGTDIDTEGITPNKTVKNTLNQDNQLNTALAEF